jgi:hypothetical protein
VGNCASLPLAAPDSTYIILVLISAFIVNAYAMQRSGNVSYANLSMTSWKIHKVLETG